MATTTPRQGLPVPTNDDGPLGGTQVQAFGAAVEKYINQRYNSATARSAAIPSPEEGEEVWLRDLNLKQIYNGTSWVSVVPGAKIVATDTGASGSGVTSGPQTIHPARTISDPFGTAVPFMLVIYAFVLVDSNIPAGAAGASFDLCSPSLSATVLRRVRVPPGVATPAILYAQSFPSGGSQSYSTRMTEWVAMSSFYYADPVSNAAVYIALPLFQ